MAHRWVFRKNDLILAYDLEGIRWKGCSPRGMSLEGTSIASVLSQHLDFQRAQYMLDLFRRIRVLALEPVHIALLALHVLHQPAQRAEPRLAPAAFGWAFVDLGVVLGASDVRAYLLQFAERLAAPLALVRAPVP